MVQNFIPNLTSIIIPTRPRSKFTSVKTLIKNRYLINDCLIDIPKNVLCPYEIIIVCNGDENTDFVNFIKDHKSVDKYAILSTNVGISRGMNIGAEMAEGEFLCICNDDVEIGPGSIEEMLKVLKEENVGQVGPEGAMWHRRKPIKNVPKDIVREVDAIAGYIFIIKRIVFDIFGGLDTNYTPAFVEDIDISFSVRDAGYKCLTVPNADVKHHHISGASSNNAAIHYMNDKKSYRLDLDEKNLTYFEKKWEKYWIK